MEWIIVYPNRTYKSLFDAFPAGRDHPTFGIWLADGYDLDGNNLIVKNPDYSDAAQYYCYVHYVLFDRLLFYAEAIVLGKVWLLYWKRSVHGRHQEIFQGGSRLPAEKKSFFF